MLRRFDEIFPVSKPILGMLHLAGVSPPERLALARRETAALVENGIDGLVVENYFGDAADVEAVLAWLADEALPVAIGINVLRDYRFAFALAERFPVDFIQIDSVAGHLAPADDAAFAADLAERRRKVRAAVLGGVRFKYQPVLSGRSERQDLMLAAQRCDAIVVTGAATGEPTDTSKLKRFRDELGGFPMLVGAGLTAENACEQMRVANGAIVGSWFKDTHRDTGTVHGPHVAALMESVRTVRDTVGGGDAGPEQ